MQSKMPLCKPITFEVLKGMVNFGRKDAAARRRVIPKQAAVVTVAELAGALPGRSS